MSQNSPCQGFVTWWIGGTCPPAWNGPWLPIGKHRVTKLGPWLAQWPLASALALGAELKPSVHSCSPIKGLSYGLNEVGGQSPGHVPR